MTKWNSTTMHTYLRNAGVQGEPYKYPIYCTLENTGFFSNAYNRYRGCFLALSDYRRLLFVECNTLTCEPIRMGALGFDDIISADVKKTIFGQYKFILVFLINGKKQKFIFQAAKKVYTGNFTEQEQNLIGLVEYFEKYGHNLRY